MTWPWVILILGIMYALVIIIAITTMYEKDSNAS